MSKLTGDILSGGGILLAGGSGICTLGVSLWMLVAEGGGSSERAAGLAIVAVFGGIPFLTGMSLFFIGRAISKRAQK
jgi:hypothetical protein